MYKSGDKVVIKIDEEDVHDLNNGYDPSFLNKQVLGRLEDFQIDNKKIKMTTEEKEEFDKLYPDTLQDVLYFLNDLYNFPDDYPNLNKRLFAGDIANIFHSQIEFVKALEKPSRIEVEKEKKYYVHLLEGDLGYLNYNKTSKEFFINSKEADGNYKIKFTKSEIAKMHFDNVKITDKKLEEVEDDVE